jgi:hypothetical protein
MIWRVSRDLLGKVGKVGRVGRDPREVVDEIYHIFLDCAMHLNVYIHLHGMNRHGQNLRRKNIMLRTLQILFVKWAGYLLLLDLATINIQSTNNLPSKLHR